MNSIHQPPHKKVFGAGYHAGIAAASKFPTDGIVGSSFHNFTAEGTIHNQGRVLSELAPGKFLIQFYSFMDGRETTRKIFDLADLLDWTFYPSDEEMNRAYEQECQATLRAWDKENKS